MLKPSPPPNIYILVVQPFFLFYFAACVCEFSYYLRVVSIIPTRATLLLGIAQIGTSVLVKTTSKNSVSSNILSSSIGMVMHISSMWFIGIIKEKDVPSKSSGAISEENTIILSSFY